MALAGQPLAMESRVNEKKTPKNTQQPFFTRFLEKQEKEDKIGPQTMKYPSDWAEW